MNNVIPPRKARIQMINQYIGDLRTEIGYYWGWIENKLAKDVDGENVWELLRYDEKIKDCAHHSALKACGWKVKIESEIPIIKYLLDLQTQNTRNFLKARKALVEKALVFGTGILRKYNQLVFDHKTGVEWDLVTQLKEVDVRRLRLEREEPRLPPYWTIWNPVFDCYVVLECRSKVPNVMHGGALQDYIFLMYDFEELEPYNMGLGGILTQLAYIKKILKQNWANLAEYWSKPFVVGKMNIKKATIDALVNGVNSEVAKVNAALRVFKARTADNYIVMDKDEDVIIKEMGAVGNNIIEGYLEWIDKAIDRLFYSTTLTGSADGKSSYALGEVHERKESHNELYNKALLTEEIKYQFYLTTLYNNRKQLLKFGIDVGKLGLDCFKLELI